VSPRLVAALAGCAPALAPGLVAAQAAVTSVLALLLGLPLAWVLARLEFAGRALTLRLLMLPFVVPTLVAALGVLALWGPRGWLGEPLLRPA
jgi:thiamine transport system permease protein